MDSNYCFTKHLGKITILIQIFVKFPISVLPCLDPLLSIVLAAYALNAPMIAQYINGQRGGWLGQGSTKIITRLLKIIMI